MYSSMSFDRISHCISLVTSASFPFIEEQCSRALLAVVLTFDKVKVLSPVMNCVLMKPVNITKRVVTFFPNLETYLFNKHKCIQLHTTYLFVDISAFPFIKEIML